MRAQYAIICEVFREGLGKKADILGTFDRTFVPQLPAQQPSMFFVVHLYAENEDDLGRKQFEMRILRPNGAVLHEFQGSFDVKPEGGTYLSSGRVVFELRGMPLPDAGRYRMVLDVEGNEVASHPFTVVVGPPPPR